MVTMVTVETPRMNTVSPVGSEPETSFMAASPQVNSAVAATIAAIPMKVAGSGAAGLASRERAAASLCPCPARLPPLLRGGQTPRQTRAMYHRAWRRGV